MDLPQTLASPAARNFLEAKPWLAGWVGGWLVCVCVLDGHTRRWGPCSPHGLRSRKTYALAVPTLPA